MPGPEGNDPGAEEAARTLNYGVRVPLGGPKPDSQRPTDPAERQKLDDLMVTNEMEGRLGLADRERLLREANPNLFPTDEEPQVE